jgi:hypothetical protein
MGIEKKVKLSAVIKMVEGRLKYLRKLENDEINSLSWWSVNVNTHRQDELKRLLTELKKLENK